LFQSAVASSGFPRRGVSKAVLVYDDLRARIISLDLKPGSRIDKVEICERLGVSRQPLAEAVARLAGERMIESSRRRDVRREDFAGAVAEAAFVRRGLETATVAAIARPSRRNLQRLDRALTYQTTAVKAKDVEEFYALDVRFHTMLFDRLAMRRVAEVVEASRAQSSALAASCCRRRRNQATLREHRVILSALEEHDPAAAAAAMGAHLDQA